jgi:hypothetical protein
LKKNIVLVVWLAVLTAAGSAFALELPDALKIDGLSVGVQIQTGFRVEGNTYDKGWARARPDPDDLKIIGADPGAANPKAFAYSDDIGDGTPFRAQLTLQYALENIGIKTRFRYDPRSAGGANAAPNMEAQSPADLAYINTAFIWGTVLDKKVKITVGKALDAAWGLFYSDFTDAHISAFDDMDGVRVEVMPIEGLNVGAFYGTNDLFKAAISGYDGDSKSFDRRLVVGAKYDGSRFAAVVSIYHNFTDLPKPGSGDTHYGNRHYEFWEYYRRVDYWKAQDVNAPTEGVNIDYKDVSIALPNTTNMLLGFQLKPTDSLPLTVDLSAALTNLGSMTFSENWLLDYFMGEVPPDMFYKDGNYHPYWSLQPKLAVAYDINGKLSVTLGITDMVIVDLYYYEEAEWGYSNSGGLGTMFPITINIEPGYAINNDFSLAAEFSFKINAGGGDQFGFGIKPSAEFSLGDNATFIVYDELVFWDQSNMTKDDAEWRSNHIGVLDALQNGGVSGTTNALQFDFVWSF